MNISVLGSTGSIGVQALDVIKRRRMKVTALAAKSNADSLVSQAKEFRPDIVCIYDNNKKEQVRDELKPLGIAVVSGMDGLCEVAEYDKTDIVLNSVVGMVGLKPTLAAIEKGKNIALANKETLVAGGRLVTDSARSHGVTIYPVDSEHCAIFQSLQGSRREDLSKIILTASGGPFFGFTVEQLKGITPKQALAHPTWNMGAKITIDSATLMNKGFEVIEAVHLFGVPADKIEVVVHRESIIHSAVEYIDNSIIAQLSVPNMRLCAQYALTYPDRCEAVIDELDLSHIASLSFAKPDTDTFALLKCAVDAVGCGGALPAVVNAANEVAVSAFLGERLSFYGITETVTEVVERLSSAARVNTLEDILAYDREARAEAERIIAAAR